MDAPQASAITAAIAYAARADFRQRYYANDHARDTVVVEPHAMALTDGRAEPPRLEREGFCLVPHVSRIGNFEDREAVAAHHPAEIVELLLALTGADEVFVTSPGILRFSERTGRAGSLNNSMPARFAHVDTTAETARQFAARSLPPGRTARRHAHFNVWRAFPARRRTWAWPAATPAAWHRKTCWWPMPSSTNPTGANGALKAGWWRTTRCTAGSGSRP